MPTNTVCDQVIVKVQVQVLWSERQASQIKLRPRTLKQWKIKTISSKSFLILHQQNRWSSLLKGIPHKKDYTKKGLEQCFWTNKKNFFWHLVKKLNARQVKFASRGLQARRTWDLSGRHRCFEGQHFLLLFSSIILPPPYNLDKGCCVIPIVQFLDIVQKKGGGQTYVKTKVANS